MSHYAFIDLWNLRNESEHGDTANTKAAAALRDATWRLCRLYQQRTRWIPQHQDLNTTKGVWKTTKNVSVQMMRWVNIVEPLFLAAAKAKEKRQQAALDDIPNFSPNYKYDAQRSTSLTSCAH